MNEQADQELRNRGISATSAVFSKISSIHDLLNEILEFCMRVDVSPHTLDQGNFKDIKSQDVIRCCHERFVIPVLVELSKQLLEDGFVKD